MYQILSVVMAIKHSKELLTFSSVKLLAFLIISVIFAGFPSTQLTMLSKYKQLWSIQTRNTVFGVGVGEWDMLANIQDNRHRMKDAVTS